MESANINNSTPDNRLLDIDVAKGLAIFLVVFGHIVARKPPEDNEWYEITKSVIYQFHMAFFMYLSGITFFIKSRIASSTADFFTQVKGRFIRLMPAYFTFAIIVFLAKLFAQALVHVDNPITDWKDFIYIFLFPMESVSAFLWYIYVLFLYCIVGLLVSTVTKGKTWALVLIGIILQFVPRVSLLGMDQFCKYFLFFAIGAVVIRNWNRYIRLLRLIWLPALGIFIIMIYLYINGFHTGISIALASIITLHGLSRVLMNSSNALKLLGNYSFQIYLMNTLCIGFVKSVLLMILPWDGYNFLLYVPILTTSGIAAPIIIKKYIFKRIKFIEAIT